MPTRSHRTLVVRAILALFAVSGAAGLVYELLWLRLFGAFFGVTLHAASVVVATFMGGLALGARLAGARVQSHPVPLRLYAWLELGIGAYALGLPSIVSGMGQLHDWLAPGLGGAALLGLRVGMAAIALLAPTTAMGATLPVLSQALAGDERTRGSGAGRLYAINTFGAVLGTLAAGLWLLPQFGVHYVHTLLALLNLGVGGLAWLLARMAPASTPEASPQSSPSASPRPKPRRARAHGKAAERGPRSAAAVSTEAHAVATQVLALAAVSGFVGLGFELVWLRVLSFVTYDTVFGFTCTLAAFLLGIAFGSEACARWLSDRARPLLWYAGCQLGIAVLGLLSPVLFRWVDSELARGLDASALAEASWFSVAIGKQLLLATGVLLPPTLLMGASLPCLFRAHAVSGARPVQGEAQAAASAGKVYASNTLGAVTGSLLTGLVLVPSLGLARASLLCAGFSLVAAFLALRLLSVAHEARPPRSVRSLAWAAAAGVVLLLPFADTAWFLRPLANGQRVIWQQEDAGGLVEVVQDPRGVRTLWTNRTHRWGDSSPSMLQAMRRQGYLPLLLHTQPARVLEIGLGTGVNLVPALLHDQVRRLVVVEISPAVVGAAHEFAAYNLNLLEQSKLRLHVGDGRSYVRASPERFDVIVLGLFTPYRPSSGYLFSREFYRQCRGRLAEGGLLVHWLPLNQLSHPALRSVLATFVSVFPDARAFERAHYLALVGAHPDYGFDYSRFRQQFQRAALRPDLERWDLARPDSFLASHLLASESVQVFASGAPWNTERELTVEFSRVPLHWPEPFALATANLERLLPHRTLSEQLVGGTQADQNRLRRAFEARGLALRGAIHEVRREHRKAIQLFTQALKLNPKDDIARSELPKYERALKRLNLHRSPTSRSGG